MPVPTQGDTIGVAWTAGLDVSRSSQISSAGQHLSSLYVDIYGAEELTVAVINLARRDGALVMDKTKQQASRIEPDQELRSVYVEACAFQARLRKLGNAWGSTVGSIRSDKNLQARPASEGKVQGGFLSLGRELTLSVSTRLFRTSCGHATRSYVTSAWGFLLS